MTTPLPEVIPTGHTCLVSRSVLEGAAAPRWIVRGTPRSPYDTGWQLMSEADTTELLAIPGNLLVVDWAHAVALQPALGPIGNLPVGTSVSAEPSAHGVRLVDTRTGAVVTGEGATSAFIPAQATTHGPPSDQAPQGLQGYPGFPAPQRRRTGMFTTGLVLTILGGLFVVSSLRRIATGAATSTVVRDPVTAAGALTGSLLLTVVPIAVGIVLLVLSRRR
ncbi:DUF2185 domain-containing protein [Leucobacter sp. CSA2]|uniref:DUF2185 domain-containing protein n=1 Tax=Leucobacter edaphi TaxID=2796472 RepID=A0A934Q9T9_9MICO|nr:DUF2185 domain-containing protein [Leucobacter edaphi]